MGAWRGRQLVAFQTTMSTFDIKASRLLWLDKRGKFKQKNAKTVRQSTQKTKIVRIHPPVLTGIARNLWTGTRSRRKEDIESRTHANSLGLTDGRTDAGSVSDKGRLSGELNTTVR